MMPTSKTRGPSFMRYRRATASLTLVLIGSAAMQGCGGDEKDTAARDVYRTRADCLRDWGDDAAKCERQTSGPHAGMFYGPLMYGMGGNRSSFGSTMTPRPGSSAIGSTHVTGSGGATRGGFGASGASHSSGG
jgi:hypothetical protein